MKMNKIKIEIIVLAFTVFCLAMTVFYVYKQQNEKIFNAEKLKQQELEQKEILISNFKLSIENEGILFVDSLKFNDKDGQYISIKDIFSMHKVVFRYSYLNCTSCIDEELKIIKQVLETIGNDGNLCIFVHGVGQKKDIILHLKAVGINLPVYFTGAVGICTSIEKQILPYYFCLDSNLRISNVFVPVIWNHELSEFYLQKMLAVK
jgi:hypothetical protein